MAKNIEVLVCFVIIVMDIVAGVLGIKAEIAQSKVQRLRVWIFECREPSYEAFRLGLAATILLSLAHVITNLLGGCFCIMSREELDQASPNKKLTAASFALSWILLVVGFGMLIGGTLANSKTRRDCGLAHHHLLSIGGVVCFIHGLFSVAYYLSATAILHEEKKLNQHGDYA